MLRMCSVPVEALFDLQRWETQAGLHYEVVAGISEGPLLANTDVVSDLLGSLVAHGSGGYAPPGDCGDLSSLETHAADVLWSRGLCRM